MVILWRHGGRAVVPLYIKLQSKLFSTLEITGFQLSCVQRFFTDVILLMVLDETIELKFYENHELLAVLFQGSALRHKDKAVGV